MIDSKPVIAFLSGGPYTFFSVEKYQRRYVWTKQQCQELWDDIITQTKIDSMYGHYISNIITYNDGNIIQIVDGQQRLITISLILAAIRNYIINEKINDTENLKDRVYTALRDSVTERLRITVKSCDYDEFVSIINNDNNKLKSLSGNIKRAYEQLYKNVREFKDVSLLHNAIKKLTMKEDQANSQLEANCVFARLNSTGKQMCSGDIINSEIYYNIVKIGDDQKTNSLTERVTNIFNSIDSICESTDLFFNLFLYSQGINSTLKYTHDKFREWISKLNIENAIFIIEEFVDFYKNLTGSQKIDYIIKSGFNNISFKKLYIDLLYKNKDLRISTTEKCQVLHIAESIIIRRIINGNTQADNQIFNGLIDKTKNQTGNFVDNFKINAIERSKSLTTSLPPDEYLKSKILQREFKDSNDIKIILNRINNYLNNNENYLIDAIELEHILPKKGNIHNKYLNNIGNLTLLAKSNNASIKDNDFTSKKIIYNKSTIKLNDYFYSIDEWNEIEIIKRCEYISNLIFEYWKL